uniref:caspase family protein n=1 Tax=Frigidibacter oleivorans TaxID=2487129 RepID=UPI0013DEDA2F
MSLPGFLPRPSFGPGHAVRRGACAAVMVWGAIFAAAGEAEARRLALVVGNGGYETVPKLTNAVGDAQGVAKALEGIGFEVTLLTDVTAPDFWAELDRFAAEADGAESTLFYYSGHAFQMSGVNYLIPVGATLDSREAIRAETWSLDGVIARLQDRRRQTLVFLDACRNDPLPAEVRGSGTADGLARLQTGAGTFVAFATEPGAVAYDGVEGAPHSPFTQALLDNLAVPGLSVSDMMIEVRNAVEDATGDRQTPWDQSSLREQFYFVPEEERKQELSDADFELLAQLPAEDRTKFIELLRASGFSEESLANAEAQIEVASLNLEIAADGGTTLGAAPVADPAAPELAGAPAAAAAPAPVAPAIAPAVAPAAPPAAVAEAPSAPAEFVFETVDGGVTLSGPQAPTAVAEAPAAPAAPQGEVLAALAPGLAVAPMPETSGLGQGPSASSSPSRPAPAQPGHAAPQAPAPAPPPAPGAPP